MKPQATPIVVHSIRPSSRGFSVRKLPRPSLQAIREITDYYEKKASGDYESLSTRYLYLMIRELRHVLNALDGDDKVDGGIARELMHAYTAKGPTSRSKSNAAVCQDDISTDFSTRTGEDQNSLASLRYRYRPWSERSCGHSKSLSLAELRDAVEYLEASLDAASQDILNMERTCNERLEAQTVSFRNAIKNERSQFEDLYGRMKDKYAAEIKRAKDETEIVKRDAQAVIAMIQREANEAMQSLKAEHAKEKEEILQQHRQEVETIKADHTSSKERMAEILATARRDQKDAVDKVRQELTRKHETELLNIKQEAATKAARSSRDYYKETVLGPDGIELLAQIIGNKENARNNLVNALFARKGQRPSTSCSKRYRGSKDGPSRGPGALFGFQPANNQRPVTAPTKEQWRY